MFYSSWVPTGALSHWADIVLYPRDGNIFIKEPPWDPWEGKQAANLDNVCKNSHIPMLVVTGGSGRRGNKQRASKWK